MLSFVQAAAGVLPRQVWEAAVPPNVTAFASLYYTDSGRRAVRARSPDSNPETQGLHTPDNTGYFQPCVYVCPYTAHARDAHLLGSVPSLISTVASHRVVRRIMLPVNSVPEHVSF